MGSDPLSICEGREPMKAFFLMILTSMFAVTIWASVDQNVWEGFKYLFSARWGIATLFDTYFSFTLIYLWIAHRERTLLSRGVWLVLVYSLGTIAIASYGLWQIRKGNALL